MDLLKDNIKPIYRKYLIAASGSALVASVFGMIDAMMVGQYHGPSGNAALAVFNPIWSIVYSLGLLAGIGGTVLFAKECGAQRKNVADEYFSLTIFYGIVLSLLAMVGIVLFHKQLFRFFGADEELLALAKRYLKPVFFAIPCCIFTNILSAVLRNDGNPTLAMKAVIAGGIFNVFGDYFFVFSLNMGIFGAGLATTIGLYVSNMIMLTHFIRRKNTLRIVKPKQIFRKLWNITKVGFPTGINDLSMGVINVIFNRQIMLLFDSNALAVYGVITQVTAFAQCLAYGNGQAAQPIISQNYGAKQYSRIREGRRYGLITSAVLGVIWIATIEIFPNVIISLFMKTTQEVLAIAPGILRIYGLSYAIISYNIFLTYYFQAVLNPWASMVISLARGVIVSSAMIMLLPMIFPSEALWFAMPVTEVAVAVYGTYAMIKANRSISTI